MHDDNTPNHHTKVGPNMSQLKLSYVFLYIRYIQGAVGLVPKHTLELPHLHGLRPGSLIRTVKWDGGKKPEHIQTNKQLIKVCTAQLPSKTLKSPPF